MSSLKWNNYILSISFIEVYAIARTIFAISSLVTFIASPVYSLFPEYCFLNYHEFEHFWFAKYINFYYIVGHKYVLISYLFSLLIFVFSFVGIFPRYMLILQWWITNSYSNIIPIIDGGDHIAANILLFLIPIGLMDFRRNHWDFSQSIITNEFKNAIIKWVSIIIKIQVGLIYLNAFIGKLFVYEWLNGTAIYYYLSNNLYGIGKDNWFFHFIISNVYFSMLFTWGTLCLELLLFTTFFSSNKKYKLLLFCLAIVFHFLNIVFFGLFSFCLSMIVCLLFYFSKPYDINNIKSIPL